MMFTALGTLFAVHASANLFPSIDVEAMAAAISDASESLSQLSNVNPLMARCSRYFESLRRRMAKVASVQKADYRKGNPLEISVHTDSNVDTQNGQEAQHGEVELGVNAASVGSESGAGSLDEDWTRLFLEPMLPDFTDDIFDI